MSVSKKLDINLFKREKSTLYAFLILYIFLTTVIIVIVSYLYYSFQKELMLEKKRDEMYQYSNDMILILKHMHVNFEESPKIYPTDDRYTSAIYDSDKVLIYSNLNDKNVDLDKSIYVKNGKIHFVNQPDSYYLGAKYIVIEINDDGSWKDILYKKIFIFSISAFMIMVIVGYFLSKLFIKPLKDALLLLDRFIKDTTHELNTPVSTIVTNIETIDKSQLDDNLRKKINRIDIGAKTVSNIYEDLTFLTLSNKIITKDEDINLSKLLEERVEYFKTIAQAKKVTLSFKPRCETILFADKRKISRVIDNLISNAIKYNKIKGDIEVVLEKEFFYVKDSGIGIEKENLSKMFERYIRFDKSAGGFGIGLSIVWSVCEEYNLKISIDSKINEGTKVKISW